MYLPNSNTSLGFELLDALCPYLACSRRTDSRYVLITVVPDSSAIFITICNGFLLLLTVFDSFTVIEGSELFITVPEGSVVVIAISSGSVGSANVTGGSMVLTTVTDGSVVVIAIHHSFLVPINMPEASMVLAKIPDGSLVLITVDSLAPAYRPIRAPTYNVPSRSRNSRFKIIASSRHSYRVSAWSGNSCHTSGPAEAKAPDMLPHTIVATQSPPFEVVRL